MAARALQIRVAPADLSRQSPRSNTSSWGSFLRAAAIASAAGRLQVLLLRLMILRWGLQVKDSARHYVVN